MKDKAKTAALTPVFADGTTYFAERSKWIGTLAPAIQMGYLGGIIMGFK